MIGLFLISLAIVGTVFVGGAWIAVHHFGAHPVVSRMALTPLVVVLYFGIAWLLARGLDRLLGRIFK